MVLKFEIKNQGERAQLQFLGDIVSSGMKWDDVDKGFDDVLDTLNAIGDKPLDVYINSGGGSVYEGLAIHNILKSYAQKNEVHVHVQGLAGSISSIIALAGSKISIPKNAFYMVHKPWTYGGGNANDLMEIVEHLDRVETMMLDIYKENLRNEADFEAVKEMVQKETWLTGEEASRIFRMELVEEQKLVASIGSVFSHYQNVPSDLKLLENEEDLEQPEEDENEQRKKEIEEEIEKLQNELKALDEETESDEEETDESEETDEQADETEEETDEEETETEEKTKEEELLMLIDLL